MKKSLLSVVLAVTFITPAAIQAKSSSDCAMAKYMAGHALTVIKGGATLDQTLGMFENNKANSQIINEIYSKKDSIIKKKDAEMIGANICMKDTDRV
jgi:hypothetical protein